MQERREHEIGGAERDVAEAAQIAADNPCLACGLAFEIRPIEPKKASAFDTTTETPGRRG